MDRVAELKKKVEDKDKVIADQAGKIAHLQQELAMGSLRKSAQRLERRLDDLPLQK